MAAEMIDKWYLQQVRCALAVSRAVPTEHTILFFSMVNKMSLNNVVALSNKQLLSMIEENGKSQTFPHFKWNVYNAFALNMAISNRLSMSRYSYLTNNYGKPDADGRSWVLWSYESDMENIVEEVEELPKNETMNFVPSYRDWESTPEHRVAYYRIRKNDKERFVNVFNEYQTLSKEINDIYKRSILSHLEQMPSNDCVFRDKSKLRDLNKNSSFLDAESRRVIANLTSRYKLGADVVPDNLLPPTYEYNVLFNL